MYMKHKSFAECKLWTVGIINVILFCFQDDLQGIISSILYMRRLYKFE